MLMIIYLLGALTTGTLLLVAFLMDETTSITHVGSWLVVLVASLIWPLALPLSGVELWKSRHRNLPIVEFEQIEASS
ncbi:MAG: hypothetical protein ACTS2F_15705 [Thainema sp.]